MIHHKPSAKRRQPARAETAAPAVERAIQLLKLLGDQPHGLTGQALADASGIPRATLFRMLKALAHHAFIQPAPAGGWQLGPELARLAQRAAQPVDLMGAAPPVMHRLASEVSETVKLVVIDGAEALTVLVADPHLEARVTARVGTRVPLHIGGSQRLLLAHAGTPLWRQILAGPLERRTARTLVEPAKLRTSLEQLKRGDSEQSVGEGIDGVGAASALVRGANDRVLGALVAVYIHAGKSVRQLQHIRAQVEASAANLSAMQIEAVHAKH
ncbi:MAG: hypothetical protein RL522_1270 [Pseudomonadota bacterium]|jgi:IclR family acetate operon transcriptional repressor